MGKRKTVKNIIIEYLKKHDYDGLAGDDCGCEINDLMICDSPCENCIPAYKVKPSQDFIDEWGESVFMLSLSKKGRIK